MSRSERIGVQQAADILRVHPNTIRNWTKSGLLSDVRVEGTRQRRLSRQQVEEMAEHPWRSPITPDAAKAYADGYKQGRADALVEVRAALKGVK